MIRTEGEFQQTLEQLQQMYRALAELREEVLPENPRTFAVLSEGLLDYIRQFLKELETYRLSLMAELPFRRPTRHAG